MSPVILLLSTYPFQQPRHGGQLRLASLARAYAAAGWQVESLAVYEPEAYDTEVLGLHDISFPMDSRYRLLKGRKPVFINDYLSGIYAAADDGGFPQIERHLPARLDAIHVEQPWLWPLAKRIFALPRFNHVKLILGSQNIEFELKLDIFHSCGTVDTLGALQDIQALERQSVSEADLVLAVTESDYNKLAAMGARTLLLAPNGIQPWKASNDALARWRSRLPKVPWILYVASAHPPNFTGFVHCVGDSLACIPPNAKLVLAGGVTEHIYHVLNKTRRNSLNLSRLELLFTLSDEDLAAVKTLAHAFLLPIQHGGGSNIKTAEALYSGKYVIGSPAAFRGYSKWTHLPEVTQAHSPTEFQQAMRSILLKPALNPGPISDTDLRADLRWDHCLSPVPQALAQWVNKE